MIEIVLLGFLIGTLGLAFVYLMFVGLRDRSARAKMKARQDGVDDSGVTLEKQQVRARTSLRSSATYAHALH